MTRGVKFGQDAARRIIAATRAYERGNRDQPAVRFRPGTDDGAGIKLARTTEKWARGAVQELELIYEDSCDEEGGGSEGPTLEAHNESFDVDAGALVIIGLATNGCWYLIEASDDCDDGSGSDCGCVSIGGQDLTELGGYDATKTQVLGHQSGCLSWIDTTECDEGSS